MALFIKDITGTQTDCQKPLSRKALRKLCWHHPGSTSGGWLQGLLGRKRGKVHRSGARLTYKDRLEARGRLADGTGYQLIKKVPVTLFDCMAATGVYNRYRRLKDR